MILVAPSEPGQIVSLGQSSSVPEQYGADILVLADSPIWRGRMVGIQRKTFPADYLASRDDGRLATSLTKLTQCAVRILILEGQPRWTSSGALVHAHSTLQRAHLRSQLFTASIDYGIVPHWTDDVLDTADFIRDLARWLDKPNHHSLDSRPAPFKPEGQREFTERDWAIHILQGFDGIGPELAGKIYDHFGEIPLAWTRSPQELAEVERMGPGKVKRIMRLVKGLANAHAR